ncbi:serine hydrolase [Rhodococcus sp. 15-725-2-2b]|uniref:serine hydrolase n=1 Tax=unclassified Rhodococcus (in: high G+C Gram-positive bacteria) TaxID=192944 RepID=UPI000B9C3E05|nr:MULTISPECIES: serine hydrolase [unclassified Rhodococcus (in: high G+C Gram-positive bacteria)]OZC67371.1 serine hydrolase [Rhodococcus sp. 06-469-3-2]OZD49349.1 serine hydrolase [Rhodococcus sp. 06-1477-1A]OZE71832.1 serine hydrolase [Rhodococcus sp. 15-725-2-2b]
MRRLTLVSTTCAAVLLMSGCATSTESDTAEAATSTPENCAAVTSTDLGTEDGWIGLIDQMPNNVGLVIDDGRGRTVEHRADQEQVLASAIKVVHLAAYAQAVANGSIDPNEQVALSDWERWYVPGTDANAHPKALTRLGIANAGTNATDPNATVRIDDMVSAMIQESDNSVPDYLRYRLGDQALVDAAAAGGWENFELPSMVADMLSLYDPALADADRWETAQKWAFDPQFRAQVEASAQPATYEDQAARVQNSFRGASAEQLNGMYRAFTDGTYGDASDTILRQLEWQPAGDGVLGVGFKGGSLAGVLTQGFELRRTDGTVATAVWLIDGLPADRFDQAMAQFGVQQQLIVEAMLSPEVLDRIACVV